MKSKLFIFIALICFTFLLLEIPKQYYKAQDQKLLLEQGNEQYKTTTTRTEIDLSLKLNSFFSYATGMPTSGIGYTNILSESESATVVENILIELRLLTDKRFGSLFTDTEQQPITGRCFTAQVFYRKEETQYVWEAGFLELFTPKNNLPFAKIIYDTDTYKILVFMWEFPKEETYTEDVLAFDWSSALEYYEDITDEICIEDYISVGITYPSSMPYKFLESSSLFQDLNELADYFWHRDYYDKIQE